MFIDQDVDCQAHLLICSFELSSIFCEIFVTPKGAPLIIV